MTLYIKINLATLRGIQGKRLKYYLRRHQNISTVATTTNEAEA